MSDHPLAAISKRPKKWMQSAGAEMKRKGTTGSFTAYAKQHGMSTEAEASAKYNAPGKIGKKARFAYVAEHGHGK